MANDIPTDAKTRKQIVQRTALRYLRANQDEVDDFDKYDRMERWWRQTEENAAEGDEYSVRLGLAFSLIENMHAKITEPLFQMGLPCDTYPKRLGDVSACKKIQQIQRNFYAGATFQEGLSKSKKSMCIVGHRWEFDGFMHVERKGKMWGMEERKVEVEKNGQKFTTTEQVQAEIETQRIIHYGFYTDFPHWRSVHPEPGRTTVDTGLKTDMSWVNLDLGYLALEDLAKMMRYDPNTKTDVPFYDFDEMLASYGKAAQDRYKKIMLGESGAVDNFGAIIQPSRDWDYQASRHPGRGDNRLAQSQALNDRDSVWMVQHRDMGEILTIANGKWLVHRQRDPWHVPGLKVRIENFYTDPDRLRGRGVIEPAEGELGEFDDIHSLAMSNIFKMVNRKTYVLNDALENEDEFLDPRSAGLVRIKSDQTDVRSAVLESTPNSPLNEMMTVESDLRSIIEKVSGDLDSGRPLNNNRQMGKKTATEVESVLNNLSPLYGRFQRQARWNECRRCENMADMLDQFHFKKMSYRLIRPDGGTAFAEFDRSDIDTGGRGFLFGFSADPQWGNPAQRLAMKRAVFQEGQAFNQLPPAVRGPNSPIVNLSELFRDILQESGYIDTSSIFTASDGSISPEEELQILAQGGTVKACGGDLMKHVTTHLHQLASPGLKGAIDSGKADPQTAKKLMLLIDQTTRAIKAFAANPSEEAGKQLSKSGMGFPKAPETTEK